MSIKQKLLSGSFLLSLGTLASYVLGAVRDIIFGNYFGVSGLTDAYLGAFLLADILMMIFISSALLGLVTPLYLREKNNSQNRAEKIFGNFFASLLLIFAGVLLIAGIFIEDIFQKISPKIFFQNPYEFVYMGRLFLVSNFLFAVSNFFGTYLMAHKYFVSTSIAPLFYNVGIIIGIFLFSEHFGILSAAYGAVFGAFLHLLMRVIEYFYYIKKSKYTFFGFNIVLDFKDPLLKELALSMFWKVGGLIIVPLTFILFIRFSSNQEGLYTAFQYMRNIQSAPVAIFGIAFSTAVFPILSQNQAENSFKKFSQNFWRVFVRILHWTLPCAIGMFFLGSDVIALLYGIEKKSSAFFWIQVLSIFLSGVVVFEALFHILSRSFYSSKDISTPLFGGIVFFSMSFLTLIIGKFFTKNNSENFVYFLGGAYFVGYISQSIFLFVRGLQKKIFSLPPQNYLQRISLFFLWSGIMGIFLYITKTYSGIFWIFSSKIANIIYISLVSAGIYFIPLFKEKIVKFYKKRYYLP